MRHRHEIEFVCEWNDVTFSIYRHHLPAFLAVAPRLYDQ